MVSFLEFSHKHKRYSNFKQKLTLLKRIVLRTEVAIITSLTILIIFFTMLNPLFFSWTNFTLIMSVGSELGLVAIGLAFLVISGEFDLSVGALFALTPLIIILLGKLGINLIIAMFISILITIGVGLINGFISVYAKIPSFITTLGSMFAIRGVMLLITGGLPVKMSSSDTLMLILGGNVYHGLRTSFIWFVLTVVILTIILELTPYGNRVYAVGANPRVAEELGVDIKKIKLINFVICSFLAGMGGCVALERLKMVDPLLGSGMELEAVAAITLGGCLLSGGYGSIIGTAIAAILIAMVYSSLVIVGIQAYWYRGIIGIILLIAASLNRYVITIIMKYR